MGNDSSLLAPSHALAALAARVCHRLRSRSGALSLKPRQGFSLEVASHKTCLLALLHSTCRVQGTCRALTYRALPCTTNASELHFAFRLLTTARATIIAIFQCIGCWTEAATHWNAWIRKPPANQLQKPPPDQSDPRLVRLEKNHTDHGHFHVNARSLALSDAHCEHARATSHSISLALWALQEEDAAILAAALHLRTSCCSKRLPHAEPWPCQSALEPL